MSGQSSHKTVSATQSFMTALCMSVRGCPNDLNLKKKKNTHTQNKTIVLLYRQPVNPPVTASHGPPNEQ